MERIFIANSQADLLRAFSLLKELRPHLNEEDFFKIYKIAKENDQYQIVCLEYDGQLVALMGCRLLADFVRGLHLYIDDLVSAESMRSRGYGARLLQYAELMAKENNCGSLRLCAVIENYRGIQFYEKNGWNKRAFAFSKKIDR